MQLPSSVSASSFSQISAFTCVVVVVEVAGHIFDFAWLVACTDSREHTLVRIFFFSFGSLVVSSKSRSPWLPGGRGGETPPKPSNEHRDGFVTHRGVRLERRETDKKKARAGGINRPYITGPC